MTNNFLLGKQEDRRSDLEKQLGIEIVGENVDPCPFNRGKYVELVSSGGSYHGVYRGITKAGHIVLLPHLADFTYNEESVWKSNSPRIKEYFWNSDRPLLVLDSSVSAIVPETREEIEFGAKMKRIVIAKK